MGLDAGTSTGVLTTKNDIGIDAFAKNVGNSTLNTNLGTTIDANNSVTMFAQTTPRWKTIGLISDPTKSGIVGLADLSQNKAVLYIIKY